MGTRSDTPEYECFGGPYDGTMVACAAHRLEVHQFVGSPYVHVYDLEQTDTGERVWTYRGAHEVPAPRRAA